MSIRFPHSRFRIEGSNYGVIAYRGFVSEARDLASKMVDAQWGRKLNPRTNRPILGTGESYGKIRIYDRVERTYVPLHK